MISILYITLYLVTQVFSNTFSWEQPAQPKGDSQPSMGDIQDAINMFTNRQFKYAKVLNDDTFENVIGSSSKDWVLIFYHDQCTDCLIQKISWDQFEQKYSEYLNVNVGVVDVHKSTKLAVRFRVFDDVPQYFYTKEGIMYNLTSKFQD